MTTTVEIIADSISPSGNRITTMLCTYPRRIHAEVMTHRDFSRNGKSSRAIPVRRYIEEATHNPARKLQWQRANKGMQGGAVIEGDVRQHLEDSWDAARYAAIDEAECQLELGASKQDINRILEPYIHMSLLITATEWANFFFLRCSNLADPEMTLLADTMLGAYLRSEPKPKAYGEWHIPFADKHIDTSLNNADQLKISVARCARLSYMTFDNEIDYAKDFALFDQLLSDGHWSPFEHCAFALDGDTRSGNFVGWQQYRKLFGRENLNGEWHDLYELGKHRKVID